jgi:hypothetical protein
LKLNSAISGSYDLNTGIVDGGGERTRRRVQIPPSSQESYPERNGSHFTAIGHRRAIAIRRRITHCKKHHCALERDLIAPCSDHHWNVLNKMTNIAAQVLGTIYRRTPRWWSVTEFDDREITAIPALSYRSVYRRSMHGVPLSTA